LIAARRAGPKTVPAIIREVTCDEDYLILALVENVDHAEMTPVEEGEGYLALKEKMGWSNSEISRKVSVACGGFRSVKLLPLGLFASVEGPLPLNSM